jgi:hypothetical protein
MTEDTARDVAQWLAVAAGYDLAEFAEPEVSPIDGGWSAHFQGVSGAPGDHFHVTMEEEGHRSRVSVGR